MKNEEEETANGKRFINPPPLSVAYCCDISVAYCCDVGGASVATYYWLTHFFPPFQHVLSERLRLSA